MKVIGFGASTSSVSINKKLAQYACSFFDAHIVEILDLNDFEMPLFSVDREKQDGIPQLAYNFASKIDQSDLLIISFAEHNGSYTVAFKNIFDWISRIPKRKAFGEKQMLLLSTSTGLRGGSSVLEIAKNRMPFSGGKVCGTFSLPSFEVNFDTKNGIINKELKSELLEVINKTKGILSEL